MPPPKYGSTAKEWADIDYETAQAALCAAELAGPFARPEHVHNALLESVLVHARSLNDFLSERTKGPAPKSDDLRPEQFLAVTWTAPNPLSDPASDPRVRRINKEIVHLTSTRDPKNKDWHLRDVLIPVLVELEKFYDKAKRPFPAHAADCLASHRRTLGEGRGGPTPPADGGLLRGRSPSDVVTATFPAPSK